MSEQGREEETAPAGRPSSHAGRFTLMRIGPLEVEAHVALLPLLVLVGFVLSTSLLPRQEGGGGEAIDYWIMGAIGAALLLVSVFTHELAHALTARAHGLPVRRVSLFFHGDRPDERHEGSTPGAEMLIAGVGPASSILLGAGAWIAALWMPEARLVTPLLRFLGVANLLLGLASLIPAFPLDGGRLIRAFFWQLTGSRLQGTRWACLAGRVLAAVLLAFGLVQLLSGGFSSGAFWSLALAFLIHVQATATWRLARVREGLAGLAAGDLVEPLPAILPRQVSVQDALFSPEHASARGSSRGCLVEFHGRLGGVVALRDLRGVAESARASTPVWEVTTRLRREHLLPAGLAAGEAFQRLLLSRLPLLPVQEGEQLRGVLTRESFERAIANRTAGRAVGAPAHGNPASPAA